MPEAPAVVELLQDFHFLRPWWLLAALPALWLGVQWARRRRAGSHWEDAVEPELLAVLLEPSRQSGRRRFGWLLAAVLLVGAVGVAGPAWEKLPRPVEQKNDALIVLFDLSLSMYAEDLAPSRLTRARHKIADVLRRREEGFTALVAFAGDAHTVSPLTDDTRTIENLLNALSPAMMPVLGSDTGAAMRLAHQLFDNAHMNQGRILLVTDGIDRFADVTDFSDPRFPLSILGIGTPEGAPIPLDFANQPGRFLQTQDGNTVRPRLDDDRLATAAGLCHGRYRTIAVGDADIDDLLATPLPQDDATIEVEREFDTWADVGYWAALALLPFLLLGFRRGLLACLVLCLVPMPAMAGLWDDLWQRRDRQALEALHEGEPETAAELFSDEAWRNAARYRSENYEGAAGGWAAQASAQPSAAESHYNLGNALARLGDFESAIDAYERALGAAPGHEDAAFNKSLVEQLRQQQQQAAEQDNQEQQNEGGNNPENARQPQDGAPDEQRQSDDQQQASEQNQNDTEQQQQQQEDQSGEGANQDQMQAQLDDAARDEQREALEQWLRRVPDDPGGLLRRKFEYETNLRLRRGEQPEQRKVW